MDYGFDIHATEDEKYDFVILVAKGEYKFDAIVKWITDKNNNGRHNSHLVQG